MRKIRSDTAFFILMDHPPASTSPVADVRSTSLNTVTPSVTAEVAPTRNAMPSNTKPHPRRPTTKPPTSPSAATLDCDAGAVAPGTPASATWTSCGTASYCSASSSACNDPIATPVASPTREYQEHRAATDATMPWMGITLLREPPAQQQQQSCRTARVAPVRRLNMRRMLSPRIRRVDPALATRRHSHSTAEMAHNRSVKVAAIIAKLRPSGKTSPNDRKSTHPTRVAHKAHSTSMWTRASSRRHNHHPQQDLGHHRTEPSARLHAHALPAAASGPCAAVVAAFRDSTRLAPRQEAVLTPESRRTDGCCAPASVVREPPDEPAVREERPLGPRTIFGFLE